MECEAARRAVDRDARCVHLRAWPGGAESVVVRGKIISGCIDTAIGKLVIMADTNGKAAPVKFTLDGKEVEALPGETIWQVAKRQGIEIPHLCYSPEPGYRADGNCSACMVEIDRERMAAASCIRKPSEGMKVKATSERAKTARQMVFELLVTDQPERA